MIDLQDLVVSHVMHKLKVRDFHEGKTLLEDWTYRYAAEDHIDRMTNVELLAAIGSATEWRESGEEIGL